MKRYYFELLDENFTNLGASIADGSSKNTALNAAKRFMKANGLIYAQLQVNSMLTDNLLDIIDIDLTEEAEPAQQPQAEQEAAADFAKRLDNAASNEEYSAALADIIANLGELGRKIERDRQQLDELQKECDDFGRRLAESRAAIEAEEAENRRRGSSPRRKEAERAEEDARAAEKAAKFVEDLQRTVEEIEQKLAKQDRPEAADFVERVTRGIVIVKGYTPPELADGFRYSAMDYYDNKIVWSDEPQEYGTDDHVKTEYNKIKSNYDNGINN